MCMYWARKEGDGGWTMSFTPTLTAFEDELVFFVLNFCWSRLFLDDDARRRLMIGGAGKVS